MSELMRTAILEALRGVVDPATGDNVVDAGFVTGLVVKNGRAGFVLDIGDRDGTAYQKLADQAEAVVKALAGIEDCTVVLTAEHAAPAHAAPPRSGHRPIPGASASDPAESGIRDVKAIIAVASGKGGVGKSTTAVNLALALSAAGLKVGLLDADIYGPSVPLMLGIEPGAKPKSDGKKIRPIEARGLKTLSMGNLVDPDRAMVWRGPMVMGALQQLVFDVDWGDLDILVVDTPPGTGDAHLTLAQRVPLKGAVIVSTPQDVALIDARKGVDMFRRVNVPVLGLIENMSLFVCPNCGHESHIFAHGGAEKAAKEFDVPFLGAIPLSLAIREQADAGAPVVVAKPDSPDAKAYRDIAATLCGALGL